MTPSRRTEDILYALDRLLSRYNTNRQDKNDHAKITYSLRWISQYLNLASVLELVDEMELEFGDVIKELLQDPYFDKTKAS